MYVTVYYILKKIYVFSEQNSEQLSHWEMYFDKLIVK